GTDQVAESAAFRGEVSDFGRPLREGSPGGLRAKLCGINRDWCGCRGAAEHSGRERLALRRRSALARILQVAFAARSAWPGADRQRRPCRIEGSAAGVLLGRALAAVPVSFDAQCPGACAAAGAEERSHG